MKKININFEKLSIHLFLIIGGLIMIFPFIWMFLTSIKTMGEATAIPVVFFPEKIVWNNYAKVNELLPFFKLYYNTALMIFIRVVTTTIFSAMAAYGFARIDFKFKNILFGLVILQMMVPSQIFIIPQYLIAANLRITNSVLGLALPGVVSAFGVFLLRQFFMTFPKDIEEAAIIDGANRFQIFYKIFLPLSKPGLSALAIFTTLFAWKELMWPFIVNSTADTLSISAGLATLNGQYFTNFPVLMAGSVISIVPIIILFLIFQKNFIKGISMTGTKG